jgi:putative methyltransferase (TIGR04325 family)
MKELIRDWVPPRLIDLVRRFRPPKYGLIGPFSSWAEARSYSAGYDDLAILEAVDRATLTALRSERVSQDGMVLDSASLPFPLIACLMRVALKKGRPINVIDFGGGLGSVWYRCRMFLSSAIAGWCIVEQPHFVKRGREKYQTAELQFSCTLQEAADAWAPDVIVFSSVLQYLEDPYAVLAEVSRLEPSAIIIDRTPYGDGADDKVLVQQVPPEIYSASYPLYLFGASRIGEALSPAYRRVLGFDALDGKWRYGEGVAHFRGELYER